MKPAAQRTAGEARRDLTDLFDLTARQWKDIMEPYVNRLADAADDAERTEIMRAGLRETIDQRYSLNPVREVVPVTT